MHPETLENTSIQTLTVPEAAMLTPVGRGAIATIRVTGGLEQIDGLNPPLFVAANGRPLHEQAVRRIVFGRWGTPPAEEVVVCRQAAEVLEIHCHGGLAAVRRILNDLESAGIPTVNWETQQARETGPLAAEFLKALGAAQTLRAAGILLTQSRGVFQNAIERILAISLDDHASAGSITLALDAILRWANFGLHLASPWKVVLTGRPNVGKSSLVNALLGYSRAIVSDAPGTTRDVVTGETALDGWLVKFSDTAGIRSTNEAIEAAGIAMAQDHAAQADGRVIVLDRSCPPTTEDFDLLQRYPDAIVVAHKSDLPDLWEGAIPPHALGASSRTGDGIDALGRAIVARLVPEVPEPNAAIPTTPRQVELLTAARAAASRKRPDELRQHLRELLYGFPCARA
jgi:tRNA modification GTPase